MKKIFTSRLFLGCLASSLLLIIVVTVGVLVRSDESQAQAQVKKPKSTTTTTTTIPPTTTTLPPVLAQPAAANLPMVGAGGSVGSGSSNANIALYEQRLVDLKFDPGPVDNKFDGKTSYAVQGMQKSKGIPVTGRITDTEVQLMNSYQYETPLVTENAEPNRLEVNIDKQYATYYQNSQVRLITTVSTGNGKSYCYTSKRTSRRVCSVANTPTGKYKFTRQVKGWRDGDLGRLYAPMYFNGGIAVHGYSSVPVNPASHGCVRIPMHIAEYFQTVASIGDSVYVIGSKSVPNIPDKVGAVVTSSTTTTTTTAPPTTAAPTTSSSTTTTTSIP